VPRVNLYNINPTDRVGQERLERHPEEKDLRHRRLQRHCRRKEYVGGAVEDLQNRFGGSEPCPTFCSSLTRMLVASSPPAISPTIANCHSGQFLSALPTAQHKCLTDPRPACERIRSDLRTSPGSTSVVFANSNQFSALQSLGASNSPRAATHSLRSKGQVLPSHQSSWPNINQQAVPLLTLPLR
jgi:hypothetical protein